MSKDNLSGSTFWSERYLEKKKKEIERLDQKRIEIEDAIKKEKERLRQHSDVLERIKFDNTLLKDQYALEKRLLNERGIIFHAVNNGYKVREWDNLYLAKQEDHYCIYTKDKEVIKSLSKEISSIILEQISQMGSYSMIAIRVTKQEIKIQLRFKYVDR